MKDFLDQLIDACFELEVPFEQLCVVLPSRRSGVHFREKLVKKSKQATFVPHIYSIESFFEEVSGIDSAPNTALLLQFYESFCATTKENPPEPFETFIHWATTLLQDFNEIDQYLVDSEALFGYLYDLNELKAWGNTETAQKFRTTQQHFWKQIPHWFQHFKWQLAQEGLGTQGMIFREAYENLEHYVESEPNRYHVFAGFNALSKAEEAVFQTLLKLNKAVVYWDVDQYFLDNPHHSAGLFSRQYQKKWKHYQQDSFLWKTNHFSNPKSFYFYGVAGKVGQAKQMGKLLQSKSTSDIEKTAAVLADESLLIPMIHAIPDSISSVNITMGVPLAQLNLYALFSILFEIHTAVTNKGIYFKKIEKLFLNQEFRLLFHHDDQQNLASFLKHLGLTNKRYAEVGEICENLSTGAQQIMRWALSPWSHAIKVTQSLYSISEAVYQKSIKANPTLNRQAQLMMDLCLQVEAEVKHRPFLNNASTIQLFFKELLRGQKLHFQGEPLEGLQLMGLLETRTLDFDCVIMTDVNEGVLPSSSRTQSFIPFEAKKHYQIPTFQEREALYAYHFYRLIQRANEIHLLYDTTPDSLGGGEKSRFIHQLELLGLPQHKIHQQILATKINPTPVGLLEIPKDGTLIQRLNEIALAGFSPSSLASYIRNPIDFFLERVAKIREESEVEETLESRTFGTILHAALEQLYKPALGKKLTVKFIENQIQLAPKAIEEAFKKHYHSSEFKEGKNLLAFEAMLKMADTFLKTELKQIRGGKTIELIGLEQNLSCQIQLPNSDKKVKLKGNADRIDRIDGQLRIIDYKTGNLIPSELSVYDFNELMTDHKRGKAFQLLCYALMMYKSACSSEPLQSGILSFKNIKAGVRMFNSKTSIEDKKGDPQIDENILQQFETLLARLILEILDSKKPFIEKEIA